MQFSNEYVNVARALLAVQRQVEPVVKDATNPLLRNRYATLGAITDYVRPILATHGLSIVQGIDAENYHPSTGVLMGFAVETTLLHESGEWVRNRVVVAVSEIGKEERRTTAQTAGSSITYGRRYGLSALLALTTDEDDDGNGGSQQRKAARKAPRGIVAEANATGATSIKDFPFPPLKGWEQFRRKPLKDCSQEAIEDAFKRTTGQSGKEAASINKAMEEELERRREQNDMTVLHPSLAEEESGAL